MENVTDRLHDLSWVGLPDLGWFIVGEEPPPPPEATREDLIRQEAWDRLRECDWRVLPDEPITVGKRAEWIAYRRELRRIHKLERFPRGLKMPNPPE